MVDFKSSLEHEIEVYENELVKRVNQISALKSRVTFNQHNIKECRFQEAFVQEQLTDAKKELKDQTTSFEQKQYHFNEEIAIFEDVIA